MRMEGSVTTSVVPLGRLELVPLRQAWPDEAMNFTPWLSEGSNLAHLGETLGLSLDLEAIEKPVGLFSADILAKDQNSKQWVLIENQIAPTDHRHLGQLLTYAAGLEARTIVWIAESFRDEHRAAIDFLNRATTQDYSFFAIQIELYRIGDSLLAPRFSIIAKPNDWNKQAQAAKQAAEGVQSETQALYQQYWNALISAAVSRYPALSQRTAYKGNWQFLERLRGSDPSAVLNAVFPWDKGLRLEMYLDGSMAKLAFKTLQSNKTQIESAFGHPLAWEELPEAKASRIAFYMPGNQKREDPEHWAAQHEWLLTWAPKLANALRPFVTTLDPAALHQQVEG
jgi:hypothetical protein